MGRGLAWALSLGALLSPAAAAGVLTGDCTVEQIREDLFRINLLRRDVIVGSRITMRVRPDELRHSSPAFVEIVRDAGSWSCQGAARNGRLEGHFLFVENLEYVAALRPRMSNWWDSGSVFHLFVQEVPLSFVRGLPAQTVPALRAVPLALRYAASIYPHAMTPPSPSTARPPVRWSRNTAESPQIPVGPLNLPAPRSRSSVSPQDAVRLRELKQSGYALFLDDAIRLHNQGVSPELLREMKRSGYDALSVSDMLRLQTHGVTPQDIQTFESRGRTNLTVDEIVRLKVNGVDQ